ncbi:hypothetical protein AGMMS49992_21780 [Clostridia bacterium]|nr:hypothetical protein AGMMS49992_21780 [Clostridia bacterium]
MHSRDKRCLIAMAAAFCIMVTVIVMAMPATPALAAASSNQTFIAGNFWPDVDAVDHGKPLRLWMAFYVNTEKAGSDDTALSGELPFSEIRDGFMALYANQFAQLSPSVSLDEGELELYLVDSQFQLALPLNEYDGTLNGLWAMASGEAASSETERTSIDRTFNKRENPLGVTRSSMIAYVRRIANVTNSKVSGADIEETAKIMQSNQAYQDEPLTGFMLLLAPKDQTAQPYELEIRTPITTADASKKKPAGHASAAIAGIASSSSQVTQVRIKSGVFVDLRLYNGNTQLSFKQTTGKCDAGQCLDLAVYGTPSSLKNLRLGISQAAREELESLNVAEIHIRICTPGDVKPYAEYWLTVPLA